MSRFIAFAAATLLAACGQNPVVDDIEEPGRRIVDAGSGTDAGGPCNPSTPGTSCSGANRGSSGCDAPVPTCDPSSEYVVSVSCHGLPDGGWYAVNGIAGAWCYPRPSQCQASSTCACVTQFGAFSHDGGALTCPGNYFFCIDSGRNVPDLHCNPP